MENPRRPATYCDLVAIKGDVEVVAQEFPARSGSNPTCASLPLGALVTKIWW